MFLDLNISLINAIVVDESMQTSDNFHARCGVRASTIFARIHVRGGSQHLPSRITNLSAYCGILANSWPHRLPKQSTQQRKGVLIKHLKSIWKIYFSEKNLKLNFFVGKKIIYYCTSVFLVSLTIRTKKPIFWWFWKIFKFPIFSTRALISNFRKIYIGKTQ